MCGIIGVLGQNDAGPVLLGALSRLEYRGYDSAGVATVHDGTVNLRRATGKLINLQNLLDHEPLAGSVGIGHTRWATHGAATVENAHPHRAGPVAVVHNGIIENFRELRTELQASGVSFSSETDTETIAHLAHAYVEQGHTYAEAVSATLARLEGAFAVVFLFEGEENCLMAARRGSPLVVGHGEGEMYVGSDAIALAPLTDRLTYLDEGDLAILTRNSLEILDENRHRVERAVSRIEIEHTAIEKAGHRHFMAKEIAEQPSVAQSVLTAYLEEDKMELALPDGVDFSGVRRVVMVACGTAFYACQVAKYWFEKNAQIPVEIDIASEFRYRNPVVNRDDMVIVVSQSGETADTLAALRYVKDRVAQVLAIVNVPSSSIAREASVAVATLAGPEIGVASTKAFTAQLLVLLLLSAKAGRDRGRLTTAELSRIITDAASIPGLMSQALERENDYADVAGHLTVSNDVLFLGRGPMFPVAREAALKLMEISYIHAEAYAAGELKHGPIALINKALPVVVLAPHDGQFEKTISNMQEVMARHGQVVLLTDCSGASFAQEVAHSVILPRVPDLIAPLIYAIPAQMIAYHTALRRGTDIDQPRNLAKSVTVE